MNAMRTLLKHRETNQHCWGGGMEGKGRAASRPFSHHLPPCLPALLPLMNESKALNPADRIATAAKRRGIAEFPSLSSSFSPFLLLFFHKNVKKSFPLVKLTKKTTKIQFWPAVILMNKTPVHSIPFILFLLLSLIPFHIIIHRHFLFLLSNSLYFYIFSVQFILHFLNSSHS